MSPAERDYLSFQYTVFLCIFFEVVAAMLFLWAACYVVKDRKEAEKYFSTGGNEDKGS